MCAVVGLDTLDKEGKMNCTCLFAAGALAGGIVGALVLLAAVAVAALCIFRRTGTAAALCVPFECLCFMS